MSGLNFIQILILFNFISYFDLNPILHGVFHQLILQGGGNKATLFNSYTKSHGNTNFDTRVGVHRTFQKNGF